MKKLVCLMVLGSLLLFLSGCDSSYSSSSRSYGGSGNSSYEQAHKWVSDNTYTGSDGKLYWK